eukprot:SAG31_NODE_48527_length_183_cov_15.654762_1_plen_49_part_01
MVCAHTQMKEYISGHRPSPARRKPGPPREAFELALEQSESSPEPIRFKL